MYKNQRRFIYIGYCVFGQLQSSRIFQWYKKQNV